MRLSVILVCLFVSIAVWAQQAPTRSELERQRQNLMDAIRETQEQLAATRKDQKATLSQLRALQAKLNARQKLIGNINQEIANIDNDIRTSSSEINSLEQTLQIQRMRYAQSVRYAYRHRNSSNMLAFIFSASDFNDAVKRMKYLKKYRDYRIAQVNAIQKTQDKINNKIGTLKTQRTQREEFKKNEEAQKKEIELEKNETDAVVIQLKGREKELNKQIEKNRQIARRIDDQINKTIQREIEIARRKAEEEERKRREEEAKKAAEAAQNANTYGGVRLNTGADNRPATATPNTGTANTKPATGDRAAAGTKPAAVKPSVTVITRKEPPSYKLTLTPEVAALSSNFEANRGKLPWPVEKGFISLGFGPYKHPTETHITQDNAGITISTSGNATARSVFDGTVSSAFFINGGGWTVLINHGQFYTVYSGLSSVSVKKDQNVRIKQPIGTVGDNEEGVPTINFQVWKVGNNNKSFKMDPAQWIAR